VTAPDPLAATSAQIDWLWEHRAALSEHGGREPGDD
jgi:hypothetical protein